MIKPGWIVAICLGAFALICAIGFWAIQVTGGHLDDAHSRVPAPTSVRAAEPEITTPPAAATPAQPPAARAGSQPAPRRLRAPEVIDKERFVLQADPVHALQPLVNDCFEDAATHDPGALSATLRFTPSSDGRLTHGEVLKLSLTDPYLQACLEDAVDQARLQPGIGGGPTEHTFSFARPPR